MADDPRGCFLVADGAPARVLFMGNLCFWNRDMARGGAKAMTHRGAMEGAAGGRGATEAHWGKIVDTSAGHSRQGRLSFLKCKSGCVVCPTPPNP